MRPIDADALFREMEKAGWYDNADRDEVAEELVLNAPTIEPERTGIGNNIGYADSVCQNCGRQRVEKYESGLEICEKCHWCIQTSNFWWWEVEHDS